jgi:hypothetical protein
VCTVTFLPLPAGGYLLATNRDESPKRGEALPPAVRTRAGRQLLAPTDTDAGGTWIAADGDGRTLCVLNGDRPPAVPVPEAPLSRGVLLIELMTDPTPDSVEKVLRARLTVLREPVKAFKLLVVEPGPAARCVRLQWDGATLVRDETTEATAYTSSSFEPDEVERRRVAAFATLADQAPGDVAALREAQLAWHAGHAPGDAAGDAWSVCMHREDACSRSLTVVEVEGGRVAMTYVAGQPCTGPTTTRETLAAGSAAR